MSYTFEQKYRADFLEEGRSLSHICGICGKAYLGIRKICNDCLKKEAAKEEAKRIERAKRAAKLSQDR